jgi:hypothetical protein
MRYSAASKNCFGIGLASKKLGKTVEIQRDSLIGR